MPDALTITNHGSLITASNFWETGAALRGRLYLSLNAGAIRLMVPDNQRARISDMRPRSKYVVVSFLPAEKWREGAYAVEWMVEDGRGDPWSCHLSPGQIDRMPLAEDVGREWIATVWDRKNGRPHKCLERPAYVQIVPSLPWLRRIEE